MTSRPQIQVAKSHYESSEYNSLERFTSYWHQIDEASRIGGRIAEIGVGNGTVAAVLAARGFDVTTIDFDEALDPDIVADVRDLPVADDAFETVLAAEVLEHIPWDDLPRALSELGRVATRAVVVSVPDARPAVVISAWLPNAAHLIRLAFRRKIALRHVVWAASLRTSWRREGGRVRKLVSFERLNAEPHAFDGEHYWELGTRGAAPEDFVELADAAGLALATSYRSSTFPYHHFFVFARRSGDGATRRRSGDCA